MPNWTRPRSALTHDRRQRSFLAERPEIGQCPCLVEHVAEHEDARAAD